MSGRARAIAEIVGTVIGWTCLIALMLWPVVWLVEGLLR